MDLLGIRPFNRLFFFFSFGAFNCLALHIKNGCADLKSQFLHRFIVFGISCISYLQRQIEEHVIQHKCQAVPNPSSLYPLQRELLDYNSGDSRQCSEGKQCGTLLPNYSFSVFSLEI